jgi:hypothetical protein
MNPDEISDLLERLQAAGVEAEDLLPAVSDEMQVRARRLCDGCLLDVVEWLAAAGFSAAAIERETKAARE